MHISKWSFFSYNQFYYLLIHNTYIHKNMWSFYIIYNLFNILIKVKLLSNLGLIPGRHTSRMDAPPYILKGPI